MSVPETMRELEREIDGYIATLPIWKGPRDTVLRMLLDHYRDAIEKLHRTAFYSTLAGDQHVLEEMKMSEHDLRTGVFRSLIWAMDLSTVDDVAQQLPEELEQLVPEIVELGALYQVVIDVLKTAKYNLTEIRIDEKDHVVTVYEGGDLTGFDNQLILHQRLVAPTFTHWPLTADDDQLTTRWNAGSYRSTIAKIGNLAKGVMPRPTVLQVPDLTEPTEQAVLDDLTLTSDSVVGDGKWRLSSWFDTPLVMIGGQRYGLSDMLITLDMFAHNDHMLRLACLVDPAQYNKVNQRREGRMMEKCRLAFESEGWRVETGIKVQGPPPREIDVFAHRGTNRVLVQLKSTLRPESPWEVYKRNRDILEGIRHTANVARELPFDVLPFVITDGYLGDYVTWQCALQHGIPIGTLWEIEDIAREPDTGFELLKKQAGFDQTKPSQHLPDRCFELCGWRFVLTDASAP
jgi:hypothetical protein